jgi:glycosyltransferase involved in cell wall biosynthesis
MRLVFFYWVIGDHSGSVQDLHNYVRVAEELGHEVVMYGSANDLPFNYSTEVSPSDGLVFIFEITTALQYGDRLDLAQLLARVPRERRIVIDCDGAYNDAISLGDDANHRDAAASAAWVEICDSLSDKIVQPTLHPLRDNVGTFFFHGYDPTWERPLDFRDKQYGMCYVGHNWRRWRGMERVLRALEPVRDDVGRIALVGDWWDAAEWSPFDVSDPEYLRRLDVELRPSVQFDRVVESMGLGVFTPVIYRPLFDRLRLITCRTFETLAANTIPLFCQEEEFVSEIYGEQALELRLPDSDPQEKILDLLARPDHYAGIVEATRAHLRDTYSYKRQLGRLIELIEA